MMEMSGLDEKQPALEQALLPSGSSEDDYQPMTPVTSSGQLTPRRLSRLRTQSATGKWAPVSGRDRQETMPWWKKQEHAHHLTDEERELLESYESLDYDVIENELYTEVLAKRTKTEKTYINVANWVIFFLIGFTTGVTAFLIGISVDALSKWKFREALKYIGDGTSDDMAKAGSVYVSISIALASVAALLVTYLAPAAQGSGIPEIKAYLNGTNYPNVIHIKTLIAKAVGVVFSNSSGLAIGEEGPMIHSGAVWAAFYSHLPKLPTFFERPWMRYFRNDHDKRNFVSGGAAAGVAAAFGAPMGGVLFSLEEASSFWSLPLTWKVFFCSMTSTFALNLCYSEYQGYKFLDAPGLVDFGGFANSHYHLWEMIPFLMLAVGGGFLGALFNHINNFISIHRRDTLHKMKWFKVLEVCLVIFVTSLCQFGAPSVYNTCRDIPPPLNRGGIDNNIVEDYHRYTCSNSTQFNPEATLIFTTGHDGIKSFFHDTATFGTVPLLIFGILEYSFAVVTYGIAVPSGLFVPSILSGCAWGRMVGEYLARVYPEEDISPGTYALVGATAMLGGILRMTISLTMILLETTNNIEFLLPIMTTLMVSKWVGDYFNISIYDLHIEIKCVPFVESTPPLALTQMHASHMMAHPVVCFRQVETVGAILDILSNHSHNGFPVIDSKNNFIGLITRPQINALLYRAAWIQPRHGYKDGDPLSEEDFRYAKLQKRAMHITQYDFSTTWSSLYLDLESEIKPRITDNDRTMWMDLRPWMNPSPYTVTQVTPLSRVYRLFRAMGLRHLPVLNEKNHVVGMLTRKELRTDFKVDLS